MTERQVMVRSEQSDSVLLTGANGFLGKALAKALVQIGAKVIALDIQPPREPHVEAVIALSGDILDGEALHALALEHSVNAIIHLAAMVIPACRSNPVQGANVNVIGHLNVLETAHRLGIQRLVYMSSVAARPRAPFDSPVNLYGAYKRCCEDLSKIWYLDHGLASIGLRPNVVYGPGRETGETAAITLAIKAAAQGEAYQMPFAGSLCFQLVDEVVDIVLRCLQSSPDEPVVSDLTTDTQSMDDLIDSILSVLPKARIARSTQMRPAPPALDNSPLKKLIGEWQGVSLDEGTRRTIAHYQQQIT